MYVLYVYACVWKKMKERQREREGGKEGGRGREEGRERDFTSAKEQRAVQPKESRGEFFVFFVPAKDGPIFLVVRTALQVCVGCSPLCVCVCVHARARVRSYVAHAHALFRAHARSVCLYVCLFVCQSVFLSHMRHTLTQRIVAVNSFKHLHTQHICK